MAPHPFTTFYHPRPQKMSDMKSHGSITMSAIERLMIFKSSNNPLEKVSKKISKKKVNVYHKGFGKMQFEKKQDYSSGIEERVNRMVRK